jgi:hypothetical protein
MQLKALISLWVLLGSLVASASPALMATAEARPACSVCD